MLVFKVRDGLTMFMSKKKSIPAAENLHYT